MDWLDGHGRVLSSSCDGRDRDECTNHFDAVARSLSGPQALIPGHGQAYGLGLTQHPTGQAVSAEAGEIHHLDVLHVRAATQVADHTAEYRRLEFDASFVIDRRKRPPKHAP
jgi:hypothetical protein